VTILENWGLFDPRRGGSWEGCCLFTSLRRGEMFESVKTSSRRLLGIEEQPAPEDDGWGLNEMCPAMSYKQRLLGFASCLAVGFCLTFGSFFRMVQLVGGNPVPFVLFYSLGNVISLLGSFFLWGPLAQLKSMFEGVRVVATVVYLASLVLTLAVALVNPFPTQSLILVILIVVQFSAYVWYSLSYIPYAQRWLLSACSSWCGE
jgi:hypothetical protein